MSSGVGSPRGVRWGAGYVGAFTIAGTTAYAAAPIRVHVDGVWIDATMTFYPGMALVFASRTEASSAAATEALRYCGTAAW